MTIILTLRFSRATLKYLFNDFSIGCNHTEDAGVTCFQEAPTRAPVIPTVSSCTFACQHIIMLLIIIYSGHRLYSWACVVGLIKWLHLQAQSTIHCPIKQFILGPSISNIYLGIKLGAPLP